MYLDEMVLYDALILTCVIHACRLIKEIVNIFCDVLDMKSGR